MSQWDLLLIIKLSLSSLCSFFSCSCRMQSAFCSAFCWICSQTVYPQHWHSWHESFLVLPLLWNDRREPLNRKTLCILFVNSKHVVNKKWAESINTHTSTAGTMSIPTVRNSSNFKKGLKQLPTSRRRIFPSWEIELQHKCERSVDVNSLQLLFKWVVQVWYTHSWSSG